MSKREHDPVAVAVAEQWFFFFLLFFLLGPFVYLGFSYLNGAAGHIPLLHACQSILGRDQSIFLVESPKQSFRIWAWVSNLDCVTCKVSQGDNSITRLEQGMDGSQEKEREECSNQISINFPPKQVLCPSHYGRAAPICGGQRGFKKVDFLLGSLLCF